MDWSSDVSSYDMSSAKFASAASPPPPLSLRCSARLYIGTKATEKAPSANRRRKVLCRMKASWKASAASPAPSTRASSMSRTKPKMRLTSVKPPIVPTFLTRLLMVRTCSPAPDGPGAGSGLADRRRNALGVALLRLDLLHEHRQRTP